MKLDHHIMPREAEIALGFLLAVIAVWFLWLAYDARGKKMWWPLSGLMPI
jgi:hypothetical protein